jgi:ABC-type transporter Mla MlaB component
VEEDGLEISRRWEGGTTLVVEFAGHLDSKAIARIALCANDIFSMAAQNVRLELTGLISADDAGLLILAAFCRIVQRNGCGLLVFGPRSLAHDLLRRIFLPADEGQRLGVAFTDAAADGALSLSSGERERLDQMERELSREEPGLGAMFAAFGQLGR